MRVNWNAFYIGLLSQNVWWRQGNGRMWKIRDMETTHLQQTMAYLLEFSQEYWNGSVRANPERCTLTSRPSYPTTARSQAWMRCTALFKAMEQELERRPKPAEKVKVISILAGHVKDPHRVREIYSSYNFNARMVVKEAIERGMFPVRIERIEVLKPHSSRIDRSKGMVFQTKVDPEPFSEY